jgi:hypothetical protein
LVWNNGGKKNHTIKNKNQSAKKIFFLFDCMIYYCIFAVMDGTTENTPLTQNGRGGKRANSGRIVTEERLTTIKEINKAVKLFYESRKYCSLHKIEFKALGIKNSRAFFKVYGDIEPLPHWKLLTEIKEPVILNTYYVNL